MRAMTHQHCPICKKQTRVVQFQKLLDRIQDRVVQMLWWKCRECREWIAPDGRQFL